MQSYTNIMHSNTLSSEHTSNIHNNNNNQIKNKDKDKLKLSQKVSIVI